MNDANIKLKWAVQEAPTGRFRSFSKRGWPSATYENGKTAASIHCEDAYIPANVKTGAHKELSVRIAQWANPRDPAKGAFEWRTLKTRFADLAAAKAAAASFLTKNPSFHPPKDEDKSEA